MQHIEVPNEHEGSLPNKSSGISPRARMESHHWNRRQFESLAKQYLRLAEQADRDAADWIYEPPPRKTRQV
jgi:hypothetical protein